MKHLITIIFFTLFAVQPATAQLKGGWIRVEYGYTNQFEQTRTYYITIHVFGRSRTPVITKYWNAATGAPVKNLSDARYDPWGETVSNHFSDCPNSGQLNNPYSTTFTFIELTVPVSKDGYIVTASSEGRDLNIQNIYDPVNTGMLLRATIPGTIDGIDYFRNNSPDFQMRDTVTVCRNMPFDFVYRAIDADGDSLSYSFGEAIDAARDTTLPPDFPVQYPGAFSGQDPFGTGVIIHPVSGLISGIAPDVAGAYNIAVYVQEWRNGVLLATTRKESQIKITNCPFNKPLLKPLYTGCRQYRFTFQNEPTCPNITKWFWDFGVPGSSTDTSSLATPTFTYPTVPGNYFLKLKVANNTGYADSATALVKIVDTITVQIKADTGICKTDTIVLNPVSDGVNYLWRESGGSTTLNSYTIKNPKAFPVADSTTYFVTAQLDACIDSTKIKVYSSPYPKAKASADTLVCFSGGVTITGIISGTIFNWSPAGSLQQSNTLQPFAIPSKTTEYILSVRDTFYCPKIVSDTVIVKVIAAFQIDAGRDKAVTLGNPFQLIASGNPSLLHYSWQPAGYLNNSKIYNPVATINNSLPANIPFKVTATGEGCSVSDEVLITVYNIGPDILLPAAFTPNNDGKNDVLKPIPIGIHRLDYFSIYNRYGQIIYNSADADAGWDGTLKGQQQSPGTYVFAAQGKDYKGKTILKKGTVILIR